MRHNRENFGALLKSIIGNLKSIIRSGLLGREFTEPVGAPDLLQFRLVDMYHGSVDVEIKDSILKFFQHLHSYGL